MSSNIQCRSTRQQDNAKKADQHPLQERKVSYQLDAAVGPKFSKVAPGMEMRLTKRVSL